MGKEARGEGGESWEGGALLRGQPSGGRGVTERDKSWDRRGVIEGGNPGEGGVGLMGGESWEGVALFRGINPGKERIY